MNLSLSLGYLRNDISRFFFFFLVISYGNPPGTSQYSCNTLSFTFYIWSNKWLCCYSHISVFDYYKEVVGRANVTRELPDMSLNSSWRIQDVDIITSIIDDNDNNIVVYRAPYESKVYVVTKDKVITADYKKPNGIDPKLLPILMMYDVLPGVNVAIIANCKSTNLPFIMNNSSNYAWDVCATCDQVADNIFAAVSHNTLYAAFCDEYFSDNIIKFLDSQEIHLH